MKKSSSRQPFRFIYGRLFRQTYIPYFTFCNFIFDVNNLIFRQQKTFPTHIRTKVYDLCKVGNSNSGFYLVGFRWRNMYPIRTETAKIIYYNSLYARLCVIWGNISNWKHINQSNWTNAAQWFKRAVKSDKTIMERQKIKRAKPKLYKFDR